MISMDGFECAGHPGEADVGNWVLFAKAARELKIPFVSQKQVSNQLKRAQAPIVRALGTRH